MNLANTPNNLWHLCAEYVCGAVVLKSRSLSWVSIPIGWPFIIIIVEDEKNGMRGHSSHPCGYDMTVRKTPAFRYP